MSQKIATASEIRKDELSRDYVPDTRRQRTETAANPRPILRFPRTAPGAPSPSEPTKLCEFCGQPRDRAAFGSFEFFKQCACAGAAAARAAKEADIAQREQEREARRITMLLDRAGLNAGRAARQTLDTWQANTAKRRAALTWARGYVETLGEPGATWPVIYGTFGNGKTHLARAIARAAVIEHGMSALFVNWLRWYQELKSDFSQEKRMIGAVCAGAVLVIDDLDKQPLTEYAQAKLYEIIDSRYERGAATLITANDGNLPGFLGQDNTGKAIYSRIEEMAEWLKFDCENFRRER